MPLYINLKFAIIIYLFELNKKNIVSERVEDQKLWD